MITKERHYLDIKKGFFYVAQHPLFCIFMHSLVSDPISEVYTPSALWWYFESFLATSRPMFTAQ